MHSRDEYSGTGIGVAICKKILDQAGGKIWVEPNKGGGCVFKFTLPVSQN
ncbi:MAG: ATP-binding protein [Chitinophagales bacterium]